METIKVLCSMLVVPLFLCVFDWIYRYHISPNLSTGSGILLTISGLNLSSSIVWDDMSNYIWDYLKIKCTPLSIFLGLFLLSFICYIIVVKKEFDLNSISKRSRTFFFYFKVILLWAVVATNFGLNLHVYILWRMFN